MKIKKILSSALALIMALSLCACADSDTQDVTGTNEVTEAVDEVLTEDESVSSLALVSTAADITEILDRKYNYCRYLFFGNRGCR